MKRQKTWNDRWVPVAAAFIGGGLLWLIWSPGIVLFMLLTRLGEPNWLGWAAQATILWHLLERLTPIKNNLVTRFKKRYWIRYKEMYPS